MNKNKLARLMKMSWQIQKNKNTTRALSLHAAWVILLNEDVTVYYLVERFSKGRPVSPKSLNQFSIFNN